MHLTPAGIILRAVFIGAIVVTAALLCSIAVPAPASAATVRSIIHRVQGAIFAADVRAHVRAAAREWKQLPPNELACADQALKERGQSVEGLARKGVSPNHPSLAELRKQCADPAKLAMPSSPCSTPADISMPIWSRTCPTPASRPTR